MNAEAPIPFPQSSRSPDEVSFDRKELGQILRVYGRMVAAGEWRDYAIARMRDALNAFVIRGVSSNIAFQSALMQHPRFQSGKFNISPSC